MALEPYRFEKRDRTSGIMIAMNRFSYFCRQYPGYRKFSQEALRLINIFGNIYKIEKLNRTGWRYMNLIPFTREKENIPLKRLFNFDIITPNLIANEYENLSLVFITKTKGGSITFKLESVIAKDATHEAIVLDLDYAKMKNLIFEEVSNYMEESHHFTRSLFEDLITESFRDYLRGKTI